MATKAICLLFALSDASGVQEWNSFSSNFGPTTARNEVNGMPTAIAHGCGRGIALAPIALRRRFRMAIGARQHSTHVARAELAQALQHLDRAAETLTHTLSMPQRLVAIGEALAAKRLLDEAKDTIERLEAAALPC